MWKHDSGTRAADDQHRVTGFAAEVDRLMSLSADVFADTDVAALAPLVVTVRAATSNVPAS